MKLPDASVHGCISRLHEHMNGLIVLVKLRRCIVCVPVMPTWTLNDFPHASQMNSFTRVRFFVAFEARGQGECLSTSCTMERFHTRMLSVMYNQVTGSEKCLSTCWTHERPHTRVYIFVQFEISERFESLSTCCTHEGFHTRIPFYMLIETARGGKCFFHLLYMCIV